MKNAESSINNGKRSNPLGQQKQQQNYHLHNRKDRQQILTKKLVKGKNNTNVFCYQSNNKEMVLWIIEAYITKLIQNIFSQITMIDLKNKIIKPNRFFVFHFSFFISMW